ncbi:MAG: Gldg family protein [Myxococcales bacterium]|nr:Gldg family protein [Myxococcales bacterium]
MAAKKSTPMTRKTRTRIRTDALVMLAATIGVAVMVNVVMIRTPARLDLTTYKVHTLSAESIKATQALENVTIHVYISKDLPESIPTQFGAKQTLKGVDRAFRDKLEEYANASSGKVRIVYAEQDYPNAGSIEEQAEAAKLEMFSSTEAKVEGERVKFARYALGATLHYKSVQEVLPKALEPGYFEFELTKRLLRLKEKYDNSLLMKDLLTSGKKVFEAVRACNKSLQAVAKPEAEGASVGGLDLKSASGSPAQKTLKALKDGRTKFDPVCQKVGPVLGQAEQSLKGRNEFVDNLVQSSKQFWNLYNELLRYLSGQGRKEVPPEAAAAQILKLCANVSGEVERRHTTLTDSPGQRRIGFLCGHGEFCPFKESAPLFSPQMISMIQKNQMMKQIADAAAQMAQSIDQTNQRVGDGLFTKQGFSIMKVAPNKPIPDSVAALIVYAPRGKLGPYDRYQLDQFLLSGRPVAFFVQNYEVSINNMLAPTELGQDPSFTLNGIKQTNTDLPELLKNYGIVVNRDLVLDAKHVDTIRVMELINRNGMKFQAQRDFPSALIPVFSEFDRSHALTRSIQSVSVPYTSSLVVDPKLKNDSRFEVHELIKSAPEAFVKSDGIPVNPIALTKMALAEPGNGPHTVAVTIRGPFKSAFEGKAIPRRPKSKRAPSPFPRPGEEEETDADRELAKRRRKTSGTGQIMVVASNLGIEGLSRSEVLTDFNALTLTKFSVQGMKQSGKWQANFQNWQIRIGQVSHLLKDNLRLLANVMDWAVAHEALADIRSKGDTRRPLSEIKPGDARNMRLISIVGAPALLILLGFMRFRFRRRRVVALVDELEKSQG